MNQTVDFHSLTKKDFESSQAVRWCPGCGDHALLNQIQKLLPTLGIPRENYAFISGIGCSSRFPYYMETYGMHSIHGRAPAIASGLKLARPELSVWVVTGDGDALAIGGNHFIHAMRRNIGIKIVLLNNRIYGLTKGQASPTSEIGQKTKTTPYGNIDRPFNPVAVAIGAGATFVARAVDTDLANLGAILKQAAVHEGTAFVEVLQNCNMFADGTYEALTDKTTRDDARIVLEHGKPLIFGKQRDKGIRLKGLGPEVVTLGAPFGIGLSFYFESADRIYFDMPLAGRVYFHRVTDSVQPARANPAPQAISPAAAPAQVPAAAPAPVIQALVAPPVTQIPAPQPAMATTTVHGASTVDLIRQAELMLASNALSEADALLGQARRQYGDHPMIDYNLAVLRMRQGDQDGSVRSLRDAFEHGFRDFSLLNTSTEFAPLKRDPRYNALMDRYQY